MVEFLYCEFCRWRAVRAGVIVMYNAFFGFRENPFNLSPDPAFLYRSPQHEEALANLIYGVHSRKGFIVLTGEVGTGKTTMLECLRDYLESQYVEFAFLFNSRINVEQFFEMIAYDLDLRCSHKSKTEVLFALNHLLLQQANEGRTTVLIVDEAHNLEWDVLEEIRLLGNLENPRMGKLLQIILAGQPELDRKLDAPNLRQLKQRIVLRCTLFPFSLDDTVEYVNSRLRKVGIAEQTFFPDDVLQEVHARSQGIPRVINAICDNLLLTAFAMEGKVTSVEMLDEVCEDMRLEWPGRRVRGRGAFGPGSGPAAAGGFEESRLYTPRE
jgi:general secretion pathway protein A